MKKYLVTHVYRYETSLVVEAECEMDAQDIASVHEPKFDRNDILVSYDDTIIEELKEENVWTTLTPSGFLLIRGVTYWRSRV